MKKILVTTLITGALAVSAMAQGTVQFTTSGAGPIQWKDGANPVTSVAKGGVVSTYGALNVALYTAPSGTASPFTAAAPSLFPAAWKMSGTVLHNVAPTAGTVSGTITLDASAAGGSTVQCMAVGWTGTSADWNTAMSTTPSGLFGWSGRDGLGALSWAQPTGNPGGSPPTPAQGIVVGAAGFNGMVLSPIPEPSTFALAGLGAAALLIFRRRK